MAKIIFYPISCSSEGEVDVRKLYVWGEWDSVRWLSTTKEEAYKRIWQCKQRTGCRLCDAQVHRAEITRTKKTYKQRMTESTNKSEEEI